MNLKSIAILFIMFLMIVDSGPLNAQNNYNSNSVNRYSFDLYRETKVENKNLLLSPLSTYYALLLSYEGSKNRTKQEFEKVLYLKSSGSPKNGYLPNLKNKPDSSSGFKYFNAIWVDRGLDVKEGYQKSVSDKYFADFKRVEFANSVSAATDINRWVSEKTNGRINNIINAETLNSETKLLISNAVYFKGEWLEKFKEELTSPGTFYSNVENEYRVNFMKKKEILPYFENEEFQFISKPYKSSNISFCILLPKERFGIEAIEKKMSSDFFDKILDNIHDTKTNLLIPHIKFESSYELSDVLKNAGLKSAFTNEADFSGITNEKPVRIGQVLHKTWIELDEEKTEAAAATAMNVVIGYAVPRDDSKDFIANHPFVFFILDNSNRAILFMGRYIIPTKGENTVHVTPSPGEKIVKDKDIQPLPVLKVDFKQVSGHIYGSGNQPLPGVTVMIKGTLTGTISDLNGYYSLPVPENGGNLKVSFVGMKSQELQIKSPQIDVKLEE